MTAEADFWNKWHSECFSLSQHAACRKIELINEDYMKYTLLLLLRSSKDHKTFSVHHYNNYNHRVAAKRANPLSINTSLCVKSCKKSGASLCSTTFGHDDVWCIWAMTCTYCVFEISSQDDSLQLRNIRVYIGFLPWLNMLFLLST